jgi:pyruvate/2-oxoglutarate dehydrogenase complex dihydrolipoamide dehydrogenase (E3) component
MNDDPSPADVFDLAVIGGGSAGYAAARTGADLGLKVAIIEGGAEVGGLCILRGCMPSKTIIESANRLADMRRAREFGLRAENISVVPAEVLARKRRLVGEFASYRSEQLEKGKFTFLRARARFLDPHRLALEAVGGASIPAEIQARAFVIATGSQISQAPIPGMDETGYLVSDDLLELDAYPRSVIVLGAGAIGLEAAHALSALGSKVTVVQRCGQIMRGSDPDVAKALQEAMTADGVRFLCGTHLLRVDRAEDGRKRVWFERNGGEESVEADEIVAALGRRPLTSGMGLDVAGVTLTKTGAVACDPGQRSSQAHIFAAGDVAGPYEIVHIAIQQAELAVRNAARALGKLAGEPETMDYRLKLFVLFTEPQMAHVGLSEAEARAQGLDFRVASYPFADHGKSLIRGAMHGFVKLLADRRTGEILGGAVVGPEAAELIHEIVVAMAFRATAADLARVPHYHPTLSEIWTYPAEDLAQG